MENMAAETCSLAYPSNQNNKMYQDQIGDGQIKNPAVIQKPTNSADHHNTKDDRAFSSRRTSLKENGGLVNVSSAFRCTWYWLVMIVLVILLVVNVAVLFYMNACKDRFKTDLFKRQSKLEKLLSFDSFPFLNSSDKKRGAISERLRQMFPVSDEQPPRRSVSTSTVNCLPDRSKYIYDFFTVTHLIPLNSAKYTVDWAIVCNNRIFGVQNNAISPTKEGLYYIKLKMTPSPRNRDSIVFVEVKINGAVWRTCRSYQANFYPCLAQGITQLGPSDKLTVEFSFSHIIRKADLTHLEVFKLDH